MSTLLDNKVTKQKKIGQELNLKVTKNAASERIFVEFSSNDGKLVVQKSYQDNLLGRNEASKFEKKFKSLEDLKVYLGLIKRERKNVTSKHS